MDTQSRRVAHEIVEAGLAAVEVPDDPSLDDVTSALLELAVTLTLSMLPLRNVDRLSNSDDPEVRESLAQECADWAVKAVMQGVRTARMALMVSGVERQNAAIQAVGPLRSSLAEESDDRDINTLVDAGLTNFVIAAADLSLQGEKAGAPDLRGFALKLVDDLVPAVVHVAATARATEQPHG
jgi:hypothetical protein